MRRREFKEIPISLPPEDLETFTHTHTHTHVHAIPPHAHAPTPDHPDLESSPVVYSAPRNAHTPGNRPQTRLKTPIKNKKLALSEITTEVVTDFNSTKHRYHPPPTAHTTTTTSDNTDKAPAPQKMDGQGLEQRVGSWVTALRAALELDASAHATDALAAYNRLNRQITRSNL
ncbi:uncharacterized protein LOC127010248 [Eriocheir sinensis]|uniref:uncharacterized protein LOC127010248 n=1 Tax=Eriocheir sinensis TaxID=95602 RepID=UPI0021CA8B46|nr:uncharacterized protein LOC127010248 [Eriocheir sinensis]